MNMMSRVFLICVLIIQIIAMLFIKGFHGEEINIAFWEFFGRNKILMIYLGIINVITFLAFAIDRINAVKGKRRIKILTLLGLAFVGGSLGALLGMLAGLSNKWIDMIIMRLVDIALSYPFMILAMAIIYNLGPGMMTMMFALVVLGWASSARIIRAQTKMIANETYVDAAKSMGLSRFSVMKAHILPNIRSTLIVIYTMEIPESILAEAGLSFLGFGAQAPMTSLGVMVSDGRSYVFDAPWMSIAPGIFILLLSLSFNFLGDELRDYFGLKGGSKL